MTNNNNGANPPVTLGDFAMIMSAAINKSADGEGAAMTAQRMENAAESSGGKLKRKLTSGSGRKYFDSMS